MLIRIRRLAGSVVGASFILLLAISLLGTGNAVNPMAFFRGSPVVIEVGDQTQRWNTLDPSNAAANAPGLVATDYSDLGYGPLLTAMAVNDSWDRGRLSLSPEWIGAIQSVMQRQQVFATPDLLNDAVELVTPLIASTTALRLVTDDSALLLPKSLQSVPAAQTTQAYDFASIRISMDYQDLETATDEDLQAFIDENPDLFIRPNTWAIDALIVDVPTLANRIDVTDDEIRQFYADNPDTFSSEESWNLQTLTFLTELEANLFQSQLEQSDHIDSAISASTARISNDRFRPQNLLSEEELGLIETLVTGDLSGVREDEDGNQTYMYLKAYQPAEMPTLEEVKEQAADLLKFEKASTQLVDTIQALQRQARQEDLSLEEIAERNDYTLESYVDLQTVNTAPSPINVAALFERLEANQTVRSIPSRVSLIPGEMEMLFTITDFEGSRPQTFEEARDRADGLWLDEQALAKAEDRAADLATRWANEEDLILEIENANDPFIEVDRVADISRLTMDLDETALGRLIYDLDQTAQIRLIGRPRTARQLTLLAENPRLFSPFSLNNHDVLTVNLPDGFQLLRATFATPAEDTEDAPPREELVASLIDDSAAILLDQILLTAYLDDIAESRPATVNSDAIDAENLARQQALARQNNL